MKRSILKNIIIIFIIFLTGCSSVDNKPVEDNEEIQEMYVLKSCTYFDEGDVTERIEIINTDNNIKIVYLDDSLTRKATIDVNFDKDTMNMTSESEGEVNNQKFLKSYKNNIIRFTNIDENAYNLWMEAEYFDNKRLKKFECCMEDGSKTFKNIEYDKNGNKLKDVLLNQEYKIVDGTVWQYDEKNNLVQTEVSFHGDKNIIKYEYIYDKNNIPKKATFLTNEGLDDENDEKVDVEYEYDSSMLLKAKSYYDVTDSLILKTKYDQKGRVIEIENFEDNYLLEKKYDQYGNLLKVILTENGVRSIIEYEYEKISYDINKCFVNDILLNEYIYIDYAEKF